MALPLFLPFQPGDRAARRRFSIDGSLYRSDGYWRSLLLLIVFSSFLSFYGLSQGEFYRTESLRAIVAQEFLRSGNWIVPTLYGEPFFSKPPGMYAAIALASWPAGVVREWSARLPSAVAAFATLLLVLWYFSRELGPRGGLVAAALMPVSFMWLDKATAAEIDMLQTFWVTAAIICFLCALDAEASYRPSAIGYQPTAVSRRPIAVLWWLASFLSLAAGVLTKWTAPAFFYGTVIPLLIRRRQLRLLWCRNHVIGLGIAIAVCGAWIAAASWLAGWDSLYDTVKREALVHLSPSHHHRPYPWRETLLHPLHVWAASLPVALFALPALWPGFARRWDERGRRLLEALHCWLWPNLVFWSLVPQHAVRQSFPLYPAIAGLAAMVWLAWLTQRLAWPLREVVGALRVPFIPLHKRTAHGVCLLQPPTRGLKTVLVGVLAIWLVVKVCFVHVVVPERERGREPRQKGEQIAALVPPDRTLYLFRLKDEGIMFYYGRPAQRLSSPAQLPSSHRPEYCIFDEAEWRALQAYGAFEKILELRDEQGAPIVLAIRNHESRFRAGRHQDPERVGIDARGQGTLGGWLSVGLGRG